MKFTLVSLFPEFFESPLKASIIGRAIEKDLIKVDTVNLRDFAIDKHNRADDKPYGGGPGMVLKPEPIKGALDFLSNKSEGKKVRKLLLTPQGKPLTQAKCRELASYDELIIFSGRYEGIDERVRKEFDEEISLGDFIMTGGEIAALALVDSVARLLPNVLGSDESARFESFEGSNDGGGLLEYPQYTKPEDFNDDKVPDVLLSGNHKKIEQWRRLESLKRTFFRRPDLIEKAKLSGKLSNEEKDFINNLKKK